MAKQKTTATKKTTAKEAPKADARVELKKVTDLLIKKPSTVMVEYAKDLSGIKKGFQKLLPTSLANQMVKLGNVIIVESQI